MPMLKTAAAALMAIVIAPALLADHGSHREQDQALQALRSGQIRPLHEIEAKIVPRMAGADYLGPEFDSASSTYRLKFMRAGSVIWIDVDARTGQVIGRSGD